MLKCLKFHTCDDSFRRDGMKMFEILFSFIRRDKWQHVLVKLDGF